MLDSLLNLLPQQPNSKAIILGGGGGGFWAVILVPTYLVLNMEIQKGLKIDLAAPHGGERFYGIILKAMVSKFRITLSAT